MIKHVGFVLNDKNLEDRVIIDYLDKSKENMSKTIRKLLVKGSHRRLTIDEQGKIELAEKVITFMAGEQG